MHGITLGLNDGPTDKNIKRMTCSNRIVTAKKMYKKLVAGDNKHSTHNVVFFCFN
eukprot:NODE_4942_length_301_cov_9.444444_g4859_i0.p1 GENE.NODE_4942_length_301_cov_9.444444_g4859_i0~~NODE_4942_length_301_cov_9.444444_g4859_i0.p1  ORF type:complete len:55 (+),score=1.65 NODE_4942_length_301_cov_9.444444_g4859_i0:53-217(+)